MNNEEKETVETEPEPTIDEIPPSSLPAVIPTYHGIATLGIDKETQVRLATPIPIPDLDVLPSGECYASQVRYRRILNENFGPGNWALMPRSDWKIEQNIIMREYALFVNGKFISEAVGEQEYVPSNARMTHATACEGAKSNALVRCCKDLGIASECWDRKFTERFKKEHCVQVWVDGKKSPQWRLKTSDKFYGERGPVDSTKKAQAETVEPNGPMPAPPPIKDIPSDDPEVNRAKLQAQSAYLDLKALLDSDSTLSDLKKTWEESEALRKSFPKDLYDKLTTYKDQRKAELGAK